MKERLIEVFMDNNTKIYIEDIGNCSLEDSDSIMMPAASGEKMVEKAKNHLEDYLEQIKVFSNTVVKTIQSKEKEMCPNEFEIEFAVRFKADIGVIFSSVGTDANLNIKMKWNKTKEE